MLERAAKLEEQVKIWEKMRELRKEQIEMCALLGERKLTRVERTLDKLALNIEEGLERSGPQAERDRNPGGAGEA